jgi:Raf kinase inhibitor-like YbhB/YbcL family protein
MNTAAAAASALLVAATATMQLRSADFAAGGVIPRPSMAAECGGANRSPELRWSSAPSGTKSLALTVHDPDAPVAGGFYHWVVYNLAASASELPAGVKLAADQLGQTTAGTSGYYGPCPPPGPAHHYIFTLYALDLARVGGDGALSGAQLEQRIAGHILARATLGATASRH